MTTVYFKMPCSEWISSPEDCMYSPCDESIGTDCQKSIVQQTAYEC